MLKMLLMCECVCVTLQLWGANLCVMGVGASWFTLEEQPMFAVRCATPLPLFLLLVFLSRFLYYQDLRNFRAPWCLVCWISFTVHTWGLSGVSVSHLRCGIVGGYHCFILYLSCMDTLALVMKCYCAWIGCRYAFVMASIVSQLGCIFSSVWLRLCFFNKFFKRLKINDDEKSIEMLAICFY